MNTSKTTDQKYSIGQTDIPSINEWAKNKKLKRNKRFTIKIFDDYERQDAAESYGDMSCMTGTGNTWQK